MRDGPARVGLYPGRAVGLKTFPDSVVVLSAPRPIL